MQEAGDDEAEELPEAVVVVLNKMSLKPEQFDIEVASSDDAQAKKTKKEALIKKMVAKINPSRSGGPTQSQLEACFKFGQADKDDSFYLAQKPTSDHKKFYAQKLASILVNGNFTISDDDE